MPPHLDPRQIPVGYLVHPSVFSYLKPVSYHPLLLMLPALDADTARDIRRVGAALEVVAAGSRQGSLQRRRPPRVGLGEPHTDWDSALDHGASGGTVDRHMRFRRREALSRR